MKTSLLQTAVSVLGTAAVLLGVLPVTSAAEPAVLQMRLLAAGGTADHPTPRGTLHLVPAGDASGEPKVVPIRRFGEIAIEVPPGSLWGLRARIPGWWTQEVVLTQGRSTRDIVLHRTGQLAGELRSEDPGARLPDELTVEVAASTRGTRARPVALTNTFPCPVRERRWSCEVPVGLHDLRFHARGWASIFRWEVTVAPGATSAVETLVLSPGSSLVGFVAVDGPRVPPVEVELVPASEIGNAAPRQDRMDALTVTGTSDEHGLFQFRDLRPGPYGLRLSGKGLAPVVHGPVDVLAGHETVLAQPIRLAPPLAVEVRVRPAQPPEGAGWIVAARPMRGQARGREVATDPTGTARLDQLAPGWHHLQLRAGVRGESWWTGEVEVQPDTPPVEIDLPLVPIAGTIERGGEPVEAGLNLARGGREIRLRAKDGRFSAVLPEPGLWQVRVRLKPGVPFVDLDPLDIEPAADGGPVPVELVVADTVLRGEVVDAAGQPLRYGNVSSREERPPHRTSRGGFGEGRFELVGLPPGRHRVVSHLGGATAEAVVELREGEVTTVRLVLRPPGRITGTLLGGGRPLAGVAVWGLPSPRWLPVRSARTDPDGRFELDVPVGVESLRLVVLPYGFAAGDLPVDRLAADDVVLEVPDFGGTLVLEGAEAGARLRRNGHDLPLPLFTAWAEMHGTFPRQGRWVLPSMAVGRYEVCAAPPHADRCAGGTLGPGGSLHLEVSAEEPADEDRAAEDGAAEDGAAEDRAAEDRAAEDRAAEAPAAG